MSAPSLILTSSAMCEYFILHGPYTPTPHPPNVPFAIGLLCQRPLCISLLICRKLHDQGAYLTLGMSREGRKSLEATGAMPLHGISASS